MLHPQKWIEDIKPWREDIYGICRREGRYGEKLGLKCRPRPQAEARGHSFLYMDRP